MKTSVLTITTAAAALICAAPLAKANAYLEVISGGVSASTTGNLSPTLSLSTSVGSWDITIENGVQNGRVNFDLSSYDSGTAITAPLTIVFQANVPLALGLGTYSTVATGNVTFLDGATGTVSLTDAVYDSLSVAPTPLGTTVPPTGPLASTFGTALLNPTTVSVNSATAPFYPSGAFPVVAASGIASGLGTYTTVITVDPVFNANSPADGVTISLDNNFNYTPIVPDGGLTVAMLGVVMVGFAGCRAKLGKRS